MEPLPIISCDGCGNCCSYVGFPPAMFRPPDSDISPNLYDEMPPDLMAEVLAAREANPMGDGPCIWLDSMTLQCRHYEHRPNACRDFEMGGVDCPRIRDVFSDAPESH